MFENFKYNKFNSSVNMWSNSIYNFNKTTKNINQINKITYNLINNYFNLSLLKLKKNIGLKRIFVGIPEVKNSLNNTNLVIYIFNKENLILKQKLIKLKKIYISSLIKKNFNLSNLIKKILLKKNFNLSSLIKKNLLIKNFNLSSLINKKFNLINVINLNINYINYTYFLYRKIIIKNFYLSYKIVIKKKLYRSFLKKRYLTKIYFNKLKFNYVNLINLKKIFYKIFNLNININIINLKCLYLDNSMYIYAITRLIKKRRINIYKLLTRAITLSKIKKVRSEFLLEKNNRPLIYDIINLLEVNNIKKTLFSSIKNIHLIGIRLQAKGRLTARLTASRAVHKKVYKGNLKNIYSSNKELSSLMNKGFIRSNLNYINLNSYGRIGSYGMKCWQNTM